MLRTNLATFHMDVATTRRFGARSIVFTTPDWVLMQRREFVFTAATLALLGGCSVLPNLGKRAATRVARVGIMGNLDTHGKDIVAGLKQGLVDLGYVDRQSIAFVLRDSGGNGDMQMYTQFTTELVQLSVDVIVSLLSTPTHAAQQATAGTGVPVVFVVVTDPVGQSLVDSLAHPGANVTGVTNAPPTVNGKRLEILAQLLPRLSRVAVFFSSTDPAIPLRFESVRSTADALGVQLKMLDIVSADDIELALSAALGWQAEAMMIFSGLGLINNSTPRFVEFQLQHHVP